MREAAFVFVARPRYSFVLEGIAAFAGAKIDSLDLRYHRKIQIPRAEAPRESAIQTELTPNEVPRARRKARPQRKVLEVAEDMAGGAVLPAPLKAPLPTPSRQAKG